MLALLAPIAAGNLLALLLYVVIICLVGYVIYWLINYLAPPDPIRKIAVVILVIVLVVVLISLLLGVTPGRI